MRYMAETLGIPGETFIMIAEDTIISLLASYAANITATDGNFAVNVLLQAAKVTSNDSNVRWVIGDDVDPDQAGAGYLLTADSDPLILHGTRMIKDFRFISATNGTPATIYATAFFERL